MNNIDNFFTEDAAAFSKAYFAYLAEILASINPAEIQIFINNLLEARENQSTIFFMGNGGSAATASHFANDLAVGTDSYEKPFRAISLSDNNAIITAIANDYGYPEIFQRQLRLLGKKGDIVVGISASGNSVNLVNGFRVAKEMQIKTIAITAFDGGQMRKMADSGIHVATGRGEYGPAEDSHMIIDHMVGAYLVRLVKRGN